MRLRSRVLRTEIGKPCLRLGKGNVVIANACLQLLSLGLDCGLNQQRAVLIQHEIRQIQLHVFDHVQRLPEEAWEGCDMGIQSCDFWVSGWSAELMQVVLHCAAEGCQVESVVG